MEFQNGIVIEVLQESGGMNDERIKSQIEQTVEAHFAKEKKYKDKGIKVLSLFFIDHVKSYRSYDDEGNQQKEKIARWFEESYKTIGNKPMYKELIPYSAEEVHDGYFSVDKKKGKIVELLDTSGSTAKDDETYELIMKDKERLLSPDVPLRFIFSHSALKRKDGIIPMSFRFAHYGKWERTASAAKLLGADFASLSIRKEIVFMMIRSTA